MNGLEKYGRKRLWINLGTTCFSLQLLSKPRNTLVRIFGVAGEV